MNRKQRNAVASETLGILKQGGYLLPDGREVRIAEELASAVSGTVLYRPEDLDTVAQEAGQRLAQLDFAEEIQVTEESSLQATRRLAQIAGLRVACLNFASPKNPGGGFLSGSQAQEESLARSSGLYKTLVSKPAYYEANRSTCPRFYTDHMIYSPDVPVFRTDDRALLEEPYLVSFITAPAVNAGAVLRRNPDQAEAIAEVMTARIAHVLNVAILHGHEYLVLGAWGCGVFRNRPEDISRLFAEAFSGPYARAYRQVVFAVLDTSPGKPAVRAFRDSLGQQP